MAAKPEPMFSPDQDMTNVSPEDVVEAKERAKQTRAYEKSMRLTPAAPKASAPKAPASKGMAKGGYVKAADGCAMRGKTRGKMV